MSYRDINPLFLCHFFPSANLRLSLLLFKCVLLPFIIITIIILLLCMCVYDLCVCTDAPVPWCECGNQQFSGVGSHLLSWGLGLRLRL